MYGKGVKKSYQLQYFEKKKIQQPECQVNVFVKKYPVGNSELFILFILGRFIISCLETVFSWYLVNFLYCINYIHFRIA